MFFISDLVEGLALEAFERRYASLGEHAYPPRLLLKFWLFGAVSGVYSGREIAQRLRWDLRFCYLAGGLYPDFRTINRFRVRHREDFAEVFRQTVRTARASGLGKLGRVAIDGSKIRANTSRHKAMSHGKMVEAEERLEDEIAQILAQMDECNEAEDDEHGDDDDGAGGLPAELQDREQRVAKLRAVREQLERERGSELKPSSQKSFADPDANMMMTGEGSLQYCYNAQAATSEDGVILAAEVTSAPRDVDQLVPMVEAVRANTGGRPGVALADNGYLSESSLKELRRQRQRCLVAVGREGRKPTRWPTGRLTRRMHRLLRLPWARELYDHRKTQGERPFAEIKQTMRFRRFSLRGRANIRRVRVEPKRLDQGPRDRQAAADQATRSEWVRQRDESWRIVPEESWTAVQARLAALSGQEAKSSRRPRIRSSPALGLPGVRRVRRELPRAPEGRHLRLRVGA